MKPKIYIAGPYTKGDVVLNVRRAVRVADFVAECGAIPFVPHLTHLWHTISPKEYEFWMAYDFEWLDECAGLIRIAGESRGADRESAQAVKNNLRILRIGELDEAEKQRIRRWLATF